MNAGRSRLIRLGDDEVATLLSAFSTLAAVWAKPAKLSEQLLKNPKVRTLRAVRMGIARDPDGFLDSLAWSAMMALAGEHDFDAEILGPATEEAAELLAEGAGAELGADLGTFIVDVVAESDLPLAELVKARLGELRELATVVAQVADAEEDEPDGGERADRAGEAGVASTDSEPRGKTAETEPQSETLADSVAAPEPESETAPEAESEAAPEHSTAGAGDSAEAESEITYESIPTDEAALLSQVTHLLEIAPTIADGLRELAVAIQAGRAPTTGQAAALPAASAWVSEAQGHTSSDRSLHEAASSLRDSIEAADGTRRDLEGLIQAAESLQEQGLGQFASSLLTDRGFADISKAREALAALVSPRSLPVAHPPTSQEGAAADSPEPETSGVLERSLTDEDQSIPAGSPTADETSVAESDPHDETDLDNARDEELSPVAEVEDVSASTEAASDEHDEADASGPSEVDAVADQGILPAQTELESTEHVSAAIPVEADAPSAIVAVRATEIQVDQETAPQRLAEHTDVPEVPTEADREPSNDAAADGLIAQLIGEGRDSLAVLAAESLGVEPSRTRTLRLFAGAFGSRADALLAQEPGLIVDEIDSERNADENRLMFAAHSRLALELGFSPVGSLERFSRGSALEGHPAADFAAEVVRLAARGFKRPLGASGLTALPDDWRRYADAVEQKLESLQSIRISYQRASRIIHHLARANERIGGGLVCVAALASRAADGDKPGADEWVEVEALTSLLRDEQQVDRLLNDTDRALSTSQQLRSPIVASARDRLRSAVEEVSLLLEEGLLLRARAEGSGSDEDPQEMADLVALAQRITTLGEGTVGAAALQRLVDWVQADATVVSSTVTLGQLVSDEMLPLFEIPRDDAGAPLRSVPTPEELDSLVHRIDPLDVFRGYLRIGNVSAAETVLVRSDVARTANLEDEIAQATQSLAHTQRELVAEIDRVLDRLRSLFDDDLVRQLSQELEEHRSVTPGRFDLHLEPLRAILSRGESRLAEVRKELRERAELLQSPADSRRIVRLLESRDEQLAVDYLTLAEAREPLPELTPPAGDDFGDFFPKVVLAAETANLQRSMDNINHVRREIGVVGAPSNRMLSQGLKSWNELVLARHASQMTEGRVANVLRMLGLIPADQKWYKELTRARFAGYATYAVKASLIDRSYVPSLGTQAHGEYDVTVVWDEASPQRLLQYIETNRRNQANIILYLGTLTVEQRLEMRKLTIRPGFAFSPIVVDMPVIAWLSTRDEPAWRLTQRVTLPFTTLNPYTPFAGGEVPDEVFVGRDLEQREIVDPTGSMFVYGGRQLGKSALLRRVEREIMRVRESSNDSFEHGQVAVYLDLKSEGIGESSAPSALWGAIAPRLVKSGVLSTQRTEWTADSVIAGILEWLETDASRKLLLLLDEADNFLTLDAKDVGPSQVGGFPVLQRLKGVMERTGRRFKPVFAGLHQVQRFHGLPNTPVVHGGKDILIGPLKSVDARELVRDPLFALGYEFETPDTMWRLLRFTNYQASLIQIICEALVRHMKSAVLPREGGRIVIRSRDVDDVYAKPEVRDLIAQRFRWTINLDNRYRVIALVTALRSLDSRPGERFRASDLHDECEYYWEAGFSRSILSSGEFLRYLTEMQGLGVLQRQGDEFGLRSPSILGLLGSRQTIEDELLEAADQLEVGYQYNPTMNRRVLSQEATGAETRSPLTDSDLAFLLNDAVGQSRIKVVAGTGALGLDRVKQALERAAKDRSMRLVEVEAQTLSDQLGGDEDNSHLLLDLCSDDEGIRQSALELVAKSETPFMTVILPADDVPLDGESVGWPTVLLQRWSLEGLQSWHESPFAGSRQRLKDATGGWPRLVENAISRVMHGSATENALEEVAAELRSPSAARAFIAESGVPTEIASTWLEWFGEDTNSGQIDLTPASIDDLNTAFGRDARPIVERLQLLDVVDETPEGWKLDRVVANAMLSMQE